jgi:LmbE family N-acetylglucosaminyl deacetylase
MTEEKELIPYAAEVPLAERLLVLAPHPDDEVIGCGGVIALNRLQGRSVRAVIVTDGGAATESESPDQYRAQRESESLRGLELIGGAEARFLRFPDRGLQGKSGELKAAILAQILEYEPDLILVPSPLELHPDHVALSRAVIELFQQDELLFARLARTRIAFYEVSAPIRPNILVDITSVAERKREAIAAHQSQAGDRDYAGFADALTRFRTLTLPAGSTHAEGLWICSTSELRTTPLSALALAMSGAAGVRIEHEPVPISVLIRTRNRPALLREAVESVLATGYPAEIVIVNDGGSKVSIKVKTVVVDLPQTVGRSEAMNVAARKATRSHLAFLDDDDLFYPEHLSTLSEAAGSSAAIAVYSDAVSAFYRRGEDGTPELRDRLRLFGHDFDADLLLLDNYIPLPTLLVRRDDFLSLGGFDSAFDLFEDWDFLIRLSERGNFLRVPGLTCEIRQFEGGDSITQLRPAGSDAFRKAKLQVWTKHAARITNDTIAGVIERQKSRAGALYSSLVEALGTSSHRATDLARLDREKGSLLVELQRTHDRINEAIGRATWLEGALAETHEMLDRAARMEAQQGARILELESAVGDLTTHNQTLYGEINRLQSILNTIYQSRSWKLHTVVERIRGRGE